MLVASFRFKGAYDEVGKYIGMLYKELKDNIAGAPFCLYYDEGYAKIADIEVCIPAKWLIYYEKVTSRTLPPIKAISTVHVGSYDTIDKAYAALSEYAKANAIETYTPAREIYIKGPGMIFRGNPDKYVTEIVLPIK